MRRNRIVSLGAALLALLAAGQRYDAAHAAPAPAEEASRALELRLGGSGLMAGAPNLHPSFTYSFGMSRAAAVAAVAAIRGPATGQDANAECGAGPMEFTRFGRLRLNFQQGRWVGWELSGPAGDRPIRTHFGIGIGTTRAELDDGDADAAIITQTSLGTEFAIDDIHGLLASDAPNATVTHLWAGTDCAFR